jgi:riboflavin synthase
VFTGLIEDVGTVSALDAGEDGARLRIATRLGAELSPGDSVAVNGVCLTATGADRAGFEAEAMNQTLRVTSLGPLEPGDRVNLELAVRVGDRLGGHFVQGHVDGTAEVTATEDDGFARRLRVRLNSGLIGQVVERGSIALDGVSLTVSDLGDDWLEVSLIPETLHRTTLGDAAPGRKLNVECDLVGKHVQRLMAPLQDKERPGGDG